MTCIFTPWLPIQPRRLRQSVLTGAKRGEDAPGTIFRAMRLGQGQTDLFWNAGKAVEDGEGAAAVG